MKNDWILDVLADLTVFAQDNALGDLAATLKEASLVASDELLRADGIQQNVGAAKLHPAGFGQRKSA